MRDFIAIFILSLIITPILIGYDVFNLHPEEHEKPADTRPFNEAHKVTAVKGIIGCLSEEAFKEIAQLSAEKNSAGMDNMIAQGLCVFFAKDQELMSRAGACGPSNKDVDVEPFIPQGMKSEFFMPCFAVR